MRVLALDVGEKRIGVAVSDPLGITATPITTLTRKGREKDIADILRIAGERKATEIVVGLPLSMSGEKGPQARSVERFTRRLAERADIPVRSVDERLSSVKAEQIMRDAGASPSRERARIDSTAAAVILQEYLDSGLRSQG